MKILIAYYSRTSSTRELALAIKDELENKGHLVDTEEVKPRTEHGFWFWFFLRIFVGDCEIEEPRIKNVSDYDVVYIGSPNWTRLSLPMARYLKDIYGLEFKNIFFFSTTAFWPTFEWYIFSAYFLYSTTRKIISKKRGRIIDEIMVSSIFKKKSGTNSDYGKKQIKRLIDNMENPPKSFREFIIKQDELEKNRFLVTLLSGILILSAILFFINFTKGEVFFSFSESVAFWIINFLGFVFLIYLLKGRKKIHLIKYVAMFFLILGLTVPHLILKESILGEFVFSGEIIYYFFIVIIASFLRDSKVVIFTGFLSFAGYFIIFVFGGVEKNLFLNDTLFISLITLVNVFIIWFFRKNYFEVLDNQEELENRSLKLNFFNRQLNISFLELQKEKIELKELKSSLEKIVTERTRELKTKLDELEKFQELTVGRELKMVELKKKIKGLEEELNSLNNSKRKNEKNN